MTVSKNVFIQKEANAVMDFSMVYFHTVGLGNGHLMFFPVCGRDVPRAMTTVIPIIIGPKIIATNDYLFSETMLCKILPFFC